MSSWTPPSIAQIELQCSNLVQAEDFYGNLLGLEITGKLPQVGSLLVRCGEVTLIIRETFNPTPGSPIYFNSDGVVPEAVAGLREAGIEFIEEPRCIARNQHGHDVWLGVFEDPWGNPLAIIGEHAR